MGMNYIGLQLIDEPLQRRDDARVWYRWVKRSLSALVPAGARLGSTNQLFS